MKKACLITVSFLLLTAIYSQIAWAQTTSNYISIQQGDTLIHQVKLKNTGEKDAEIKINVSSQLEGSVENLIKTNIDTVTVPAGQEKQFNLEIDTSNLEANKQYPLTLIFQTPNKQVETNQIIGAQTLLGGEQFILAITPAQKRFIFDTLVLPKTVDSVGRVSTVVVSTTIPALNMLALLSQLGGKINPSTIIKTLQAVGLIPAGKSQGAVFNSKTYKGIPFAVLTFIKADNPKQIIETTVSNDQGLYKGVQLPEGRYKLVVNHQDFKFPSQIARPAYSGINDFYKGEEFPVRSSKTKQAFLVPLDFIGGVEKFSIKNAFRLLFKKIGRSMSLLSLPIFVLSIFLTLIFPSVWNYAIVAFYSLTYTKKIVHLLVPPDITGSIIAKDKDGLADTIVRLKNPQTNELSDITTSNRRGKFDFRKQKGVYQILANKKGWISEDEGLSFNQINSSKNKQKLQINMRPIT